MQPLLTASLMTRLNTATMSLAYPWLTLDLAGTTTVRTRRPTESVGTRTVAARPARYVPRRSATSWLIWPMDSTPHASRYGWMCLRQCRSNVAGRSG